MVNRRGGRKISTGDYKKQEPVSGENTFMYEGEWI